MVLRVDVVAAALDAVYGGVARPPGGRADAAGPAARPARRRGPRRRGAAHAALGAVRGLRRADPRSPVLGRDLDRPIRPLGRRAAGDGRRRRRLARLLPGATGKRGVAAGRELLRRARRRPRVSPLHTASRVPRLARARRCCSPGTTPRSTVAPRPEPSAERSVSAASSRCRTSSDTSSAFPGRLAEDMPVRRSVVCAEDLPADRVLGLDRTARLTETRVRVSASSPTPIAVPSYDTDRALSGSDTANRSHRPRRPSRRCAVPPPTIRSPGSPRHRSAEERVGRRQRHTWNPIDRTDDEPAAAVADRDRLGGDDHRRVADRPRAQAMGRQPVPDPVLVDGAHAALRVVRARAARRTSPIVCSRAASATGLLEPGAWRDHRLQYAPAGGRSAARAGRSSSG